MDSEVDHYLVLGLPSGEEGVELSEKEITKAYRVRALELHPDKRPDDPNAQENFHKLRASYEILKDQKLRKALDDGLRAKREQQRRYMSQDVKRRKMMSDLEERERAASAVAREEEEEERIARKLGEEVAAIRANKSAAAAPPSKEGTATRESSGGAGVGLDMEKVLKVTWKKVGANYGPESLREIFSVFGRVEDVVMSKKRGSALVVLGSRDEAVAATGTVCRDLSVVPLQPTIPTNYPSFQRPVEADRFDNPASAGYQAFEDMVMKKLQQTTYIAPQTKLQYASTEVFKKIRLLPEDHVQRYLALRNAAVVLK